MAADTMDEWVRTEYRQRYCDKTGKLIAVFNLNNLCGRLYKKRPEDSEKIAAALKR